MTDPKPDWKVRLVAGLETRWEIPGELGWLANNDEALACITRAAMILDGLFGGNLDSERSWLREYDDRVEAKALDLLNMKLAQTFLDIVEDSAGL